MDTDTRRNEDLLRLNALVDGELAPDEHAALAARIAADRDSARAYTTLARLKAAVIESTVPNPSVMPELSVEHPRRFSGAIAASLTVIALGAAAVLVFLTEERWGDRPSAPATAQQAAIETTNDAAHETAHDTAIRLAALPSQPTLPDLTVTGIVLADVTAGPQGGVRALSATYRGPHGCRIDLRVHPAGAAVPALAGTSRHRWTVGQLAYELVAHGMPDWRFAIIADLAEHQTRNGSDPVPDQRRFAEARNGAPPCQG